MRCMLLSSAQMAGMLHPFPEAQSALNIHLEESSCIVRVLCTHLNFWGNLFQSVPFVPLSSCRLLAALTGMHLAEVWSLQLWEFPEVASAAPAMLQTFQVPAEAHLPSQFMQFAVSR